MSKMQNKKIDMLHFMKENPNFYHVNVGLLDSSRLN